MTIFWLEWSNCSGSRPRWSRGNVLTSRSKIRGFKPGWGWWIFSGYKNPEHKSPGTDFKLGVPSLRRNIAVSSTGTVKHWKWCTWHRKASAKNSSKLNKFLHSEADLLIQHINISVDSLYIKAFIVDLSLSSLQMSCFINWNVVLLLISYLI